MAYIHLWRLYDYIDRFIFVISNITYTGNLKNITFSPFEKNIEKYMNKVDIVFFNNICNKNAYPKKIIFGVLNIVKEIMQKHI